MKENLKIDRFGQKEFCLWCGLPANIIWIHGHGQCSNCGINVEECCKGETCNNSEGFDKIEFNTDSLSEKEC